MKRTIIQGCRVGDVTPVPAPPDAPPEADGSKTIDFIYAPGTEIITILLIGPEVEALKRRLGDDDGTAIEIHRTMPPSPPMS